MSQSYFEKNKMLWNHWVDLHESSEFYDVTNFQASYLDLHQTERDLLGNISGKELLHLMCHFGKDSLSLATQAKHVTAVDFSEKAIDLAQKLAQRLEVDIQFHCSNVLDLNLEKTFDEIYMSYGVIDWIPDLKKLSKTIAKHLKSGGRFTLIEFHPMATLFNEDGKIDQQAIQYGEPYVDKVRHSYTGDEMKQEMSEITWPYKIADLISCLIDSGLNLLLFKEFDFSHFDCFPNLVEVSKNQFQYKDLRKGIPMMYAIQLDKR